MKKQLAKLLKSYQIGHYGYIKIFPKSYYEEY